MDEIKIYKNAEREVKRIVSFDMVKVLSLDNMLYAIIGEMFIGAGKDKIPVKERREYILKEVNKVIDVWEG